jgi:hypothetical protein
LVGGIDQENYTVDGAAVFRPSLACLQMASQVVGIELNVADGDLSLVRMYR